MQRTIRIIWISAIVLLAAASCFAKPPGEQESVVIVYADGHRQNLDLADIARIDLKAPVTIVFKDGRKQSVASDGARIEFESLSSGLMPSRYHFVGKWEVGDGNGSNFYITLEEDGTARKVLARATVPGPWWTAKPASVGTMAGTMRYERSAQSMRRSPFNRANPSMTTRPTLLPLEIRSPNPFRIFAAWIERKAR